MGPLIHGVGRASGAMVHGGEMQSIQADAPVAAPQAPESGFTGDCVGGFADGDRYHSGSDQLEVREFPNPNNLKQYCDHHYAWDKDTESWSFVHTEGHG